MAPRRPVGQLDQFAGAKGSLLYAVSAKDGVTRAKTALNVAPVFDGLIAAAGDLDEATVDGKVTCLAAPRQ